MTDTPTTPTDPMLVRLSEEDLARRSRQTLQAIEKGKSKKQDTQELERVYQALEAEQNRRQRYKNLY
jgi:transcriptional regulator with XRE-family HTH domain